MNELKYLRDRSLIIVDFLSSKSINSLAIGKLKPIIDDTFNKQNLNGLKTISRDLNAWAKGFPQKDIQELEIILADQFGEDLSGDKITLKLIQKVLKKGKIENEENYRVVQEYLNDISEESPFVDRITELNALLASYQK
ncbi:hypothetical protein [Flavobacterium terrisoli]|uniref:hypothetical protein n=1 Tax=Flavobacterium terrisoli TaxID=3242195 RepID=UPI002543E0E2|nr:hypothetical protein [Flavobacterium buctense]